MHHELVLIDQSQLRQRQRELHASHQQSLTRLPLELLNGLPQIPAHELRVPIDPVQCARHDVLLCRVDRPGEGFHPIRPRSRPRRREAWKLLLRAMNEDGDEAPAPLPLVPPGPLRATMPYLTEPWYC